MLIAAPNPVRASDTNRISVGCSSDRLQRDGKLELVTDVFGLQIVDVGLRRSPPVDPRLYISGPVPTAPHMTRRYCSPCASVPPRSSEGPAKCCRR